MIPWSDERIFSQNLPVCLEYCSGNGEWICNKAKQHPDLNWVAVEKRFDRSKKIWMKMKKRGLSNLFVICGEGLIATQHYIPIGTISEFFINFPDPWPKLKHAKHRLITAPFLDKMATICKANSLTTIVTDDFVYANQILDETALSKSWRPLMPPPYYAINPPNYGTSFFSELWKQKGRTIYQITLRTQQES
jgi:tRNA (guanine-N7-)-methyltransferase